MRNDSFNQLPFMARIITAVDNVKAQDTLPPSFSSERHVPIGSSWGNYLGIGGLLGAKDSLHTVLSNARWNFSSDWKEQISVVERYLADRNANDDKAMAARGGLLALAIEKAFEPVSDGWKCDKGYSALTIPFNMLREVRKWQSYSVVLCKFDDNHNMVKNRRVFFEARDDRWAFDRLAQATLDQNSELVFRVYRHLDSRSLEGSDLTAPFLDFAGGLIYSGHA